MLRAWAEQRATAAKGEGRTLETDGTIVGEERVYKNLCLQFGEPPRLARNTPRD